MCWSKLLGSLATAASVPSVATAAAVTSVATATAAAAIAAAAAAITAATAAAATAAAVTAATTAAAAATTAAAAATGTILARTGLVDDQAPALILGLMKCCNCGLRILGAGHLYEPEAAGLAGFTIVDGTRGVYLTVLFENLPELLIGRPVR
jgi:hypothetical protein